MATLELNLDPSNLKQGADEAAKAVEKVGDASKTAVNDLDKMAQTTVKTGGAFSQLRSLAGNAIDSIVRKFRIDPIALIERGVRLATKAWEFFTAQTEEAAEAIRQVEAAQKAFNDATRDFARQRALEESLARAGFAQDPRQRLETQARYFVEQGLRLREVGSDIPLKELSKLTGYSEGDLARAADTLGVKSGPFQTPLTYQAGARGPEPYISPEGAQRILEELSKYVLSLRPELAQTARQREERQATAPNYGPTSREVEVQLDRLDRIDLQDQLRQMEEMYRLGQDIAYAGANAFQAWAQGGATLRGVLAGIIGDLGRIGTSRIFSQFADSIGSAFAGTAKQGGSGFSAGAIAGAQGGASVGQQ